MTLTMPPIKWDGGAEGALDPIEREERELAMRRAQFALGAAEDYENLDWDAPCAGSDDESDATTTVGDGDGAAEAAAAARVLDAVRHESSRDEEDAAAAEPTWEELEGYVPPGTPGFTAFAQAQMRLANVPCNRKVLPAPELAPAEWVSQKSKPKLQPYQETVAYLCRPGSVPNARMLVVHRTGSGKTATMIQIADNCAPPPTRTRAAPTAFCPRQRCRLCYLLMDPHSSTAL